MKTIVKVLLISLLCACNKEKEPIPTAKVDYFPLNDSVYKANSFIILDFNKDGRNDVLFYVEPFQGTPNDYAEFRLVPQIESSILASSATPKVFNKDEIIQFSNNPGFNWVEDPVVLAKRVHETPIENSYWEGAWKNKQNKYLGVQVTTNGEQHTGWIRLSVMNNQGSMILHDAAISKEPDVDIVAGKTE